MIRVEITQQEWSEYTIFTLVIDSIGLKISIEEPIQFARSKLIDNPYGDDWFNCTTDFDAIHIRIRKKIVIKSGMGNLMHLTIPRTPEISREISRAFREIRDYMRANPDKKY